MVRLAGIRTEKGYSQKQLSKISGVPQQTISAIETGIRQNPGIFTLIKLASSLGCSVEDLIRKESENDV